MELQKKENGVQPESFGCVVCSLKKGLMKQMNICDMYFPIFKVFKDDMYFPIFVNY